MFKVETKLCFELLMGYLICNLKFNREKCGQKIQQEQERSRSQTLLYTMAMGFGQKQKYCGDGVNPISAIPDFQP